jgi:hypothetical protein
MASKYNVKGEGYEKRRVRYRDGASAIFPVHGTLYNAVFSDRKKAFMKVQELKADPKILGGKVEELDLSKPEYTHHGRRLASGVIYTDGHTSVSYPKKTLHRWRR